MRAKLKQVREGLRQRMHRTIAEQGRWLGQVVAGHLRYFAAPTNDRAPTAFRYQSRMRESRTYRSVRRARGDARPYRDRLTLAMTGVIRPTCLAHSQP
jgi:RNA-directed DNA polymerase